MLQKKIIKAFGVKSSINPLIETNIIINFLVDYLENNLSIHKLILGISSGQDSTLTGKLCQLAINKLRKKTNLQHYQLIVVSMPYGNQKNEKDYHDVINFIQPNKIFNIDIKDSILTHELLLKNAGIILNDIIKGNAKARTRMKLQYSIASMNNGLVVGTSNASEYITGFFTKYGDGGMDINPIIHLNKRQGRSILRYLNCPEHLYLKIPSADLEDILPGLPDEMVLGVTYEKIDDYLEGKNIPLEDVLTIENLYIQTQHKRYLPIKISSNYNNIIL